MGRFSVAVDDMTGLACLVERNACAEDLPLVAGEVGGRSEEILVVEGVSKVGKRGLSAGEEDAGGALTPLLFTRFALAEITFRLGVGAVVGDSICLAQMAATFVTTPPFPPLAERTSYLVSG